MYEDLGTGERGDSGVDAVGHGAGPVVEVLAVGLLGKKKKDLNLLERAFITSNIIKQRIFSQRTSRSCVSHQ